MAKTIDFKFNRKSRLTSHENLIMKIPMLGREITCDTYYWALGTVSQESGSLQEIVNNYLGVCKKSILDLKLGSLIFMPIDFSDEYYGTFKVTRISEDLFNFEYGILEKNNDVFFNGLNELSGHLEKFDTEFNIKLSKSDVVDSFNLQLS